KCQGAKAKDWLAAREADLLPIGYFHVVFTLPAEIAPIAYQNKAVVYDLLFRMAAETLLTIAADTKHLGARIGATAVLHTWGSAMTKRPYGPLRPTQPASPPKPAHSPSAYGVLDRRSGTDRARQDHG